MTPDDAARLLAACAAFDNRQPSQIAKRAWATALRDVPLDQDAFDAVARFYGTPPKEAGQRLWIQPHDVRTHRKIIRSERLENFIYEPPSGDRDPLYLARLRGQLDAIGSGRAAGPSDAPALTGGPHPSVAKELKGAFREVPGEDGEVEKVKRPGPLGVECPKCHAVIGRPCRFGSGKERPVHPARVLASGGEVPGLSPDDSEASAEIARRKAASRAYLAALPSDAKPEPADGFGEQPASAAGVDAS